MLIGVCGLAPGGVLEAGRVRNGRRDRRSLVSLHPRFWLPVFARIAEKPDRGTRENFRITTFICVLSSRGYVLSVSRPDWVECS